MFIRYTFTTLCTLLLLFTTFSLAGQDTIFVSFTPSTNQPIIEARVDTHLVNSISDKDLVYGTTKLPGSIGQHMAFANGMPLKKFEGSDCGSIENTTSKEPSLTSAKREGNQLFISIQVTSNCCYNFLGDVALTHNSTNLDLKYIPYGSSYCSCYCCFGLTYTFDIQKEMFNLTLKTVSINGKPSGQLQL